MARTDIVLRQLANLFQADLLPALLPEPEQDAQVLELVSTQLGFKGLERIADHAVRARVNGVETICHLEFQLEHRADVPARVLVYNGLFRCLGHQQRRPVPVRSIVVYLMHRRRRSVPRGIHRRAADPQVQLDYDVFCVWERPITLKEVRRRPALAPIAVLTPGIVEADLPPLQRLLGRAALPRARRGELQAITYFLAARRLRPDLLQSFRRSKAMLESATYRMAVEEGRAEGRAEGETLGQVRTLLKLLRHRLGRVPRGLQGRLTRLSAEALDRLVDRVLQAEDPKELRALLASLPRPR